MQMLKNFVLFLSGIFLIVFGFKANTDKAQTMPPEKEESVTTEGEAPEEAQGLKTQEKADGSKSGQATTRLEKKAPEKAGGSK